ncbi:MAG: glycosyltransferase family 9 protein [Alphaproteobacteria bacterium]
MDGATARDGTAGDGPLIDMRDRGVGDVVVACWLVHAARAVGRPVRLNPRGLTDVCRMLGVEAPALSDAEGDNWAKTDGLGHRHEYALVAHGTPRPRFTAWAEALGLPGLAPVRPPYCETVAAAGWADAAWAESAEPGQLRVAMFPEVAWLIRRWPPAYFIDLADMLKAKGAAVVMVGVDKAKVGAMGCRWYAGFSLARTAALMARADAVIGNDSGPAHLAGTLGVPTFVPCGPTDGALVFAHDPNVRCTGLPPGRLACHPCHFAVERGYRDACKVGGCRALMTLTPEPVFDWLWPQIEGLRTAGAAD